MTHKVIKVVHLCSPTKLASEEEQSMLANYILTSELWVRYSEIRIECACVFILKSANDVSSLKSHIHVCDCRFYSNKLAV